MSIASSKQWEDTKALLCPALRILLMVPWRGETWTEPSLLPTGNALLRDPGLLAITTSSPPLLFRRAVGPWRQAVRIIRFASGMSRLGDNSAGLAGNVSAMKTPRDTGHAWNELPFLHEASG